MSSPENPQAIEPYRQPEVSIICSTYAKLESLVWSDAQDVPIINKQGMRGPFHSLLMTVDGSSDPAGEYHFTTKLGLSHTAANTDGTMGEEAERMANFLDEFSTRMGGKVVEDFDHGYVIPGMGGNSCYIGLNKNMRELYLSSCDAIEQDRVEYDDLSKIRHGKHVFTRSFDEYKRVAEQLITDLYLTYGFAEPMVFITKLNDALDLPDNEEQAQDRPYPLLADVGGLEGAKQKLQEFVAQLRHPEIMALYGQERAQGILLYGPPGTGKTMLVTALANEIGAELRRFSATDVYDMWLGNSEKNIQEIFDDAEKATYPVVLYFNEIDGIITPSGHSTDARVAAIFKQRAEKLAKNNPNVILAADTNKNADELDPTMFRSGRFDIKLYVPLPETRALAQVIGSLVSRSFLETKREVFAPVAMNFDELAGAAEGLSGADMNRIIKDMVIKRALSEVATQKIPEPVTQREFLEAIRHFRER